jgi:hypothetical protein
MDQKDCIVGKRIICIKSYNNTDTVGKYGIIIEQYNKWDNVSIKFDKQIKKGHDLHGLCEHGYGWSIPAKYLLLYNNINRRIV